MNKISAYVVEFIGTFIFLYVIISTGSPIPIGLTLIGLLYFGAKISGGAFNPAITLALYLNKKIDNLSFIIYIIVQFLAAGLAFMFYHFISPKNITTEI